MRFPKGTVFTVAVKVWVEESFLFLQEIVRDPQFFVGGASRFDVQQGELGELLRGSRLLQMTA